MKFEVRLLKLLLLLTVVLPACISRADAPQTFVVNECAFPWYDRVAGETAWALEGVPDTLKGTGPLPQQNCTNRTLVIPGQPASILLGVFEGDIAKLAALHPQAVPSGDAIAVVNPKNIRLDYRVYFLPKPPKIIVGKDFAGGLLLLKVENSVASTAPAEGTNASTRNGAGNVSDGPPPSSVPIIPASAMPAKEKLHTYLLMGQSNMVGRDSRSISSQVSHPRIIAMNTSGDWVEAREPMQFAGSGFGPGIPFALEMLKSDPTITIALVPCAVGGTPLSRWIKGADLYENAVKRAKVAAKAGVIKGVLWHQGEQDGLDKANADSYGIRLAYMLAKLQADLEVSNLPIVVGQLGEFLLSAKLPYAGTVREALKQVADVLPDVGLADAGGLGHMGDSLHFSAAAQREFGARYAAAMLQLQEQQK